MIDTESAARLVNELPAAAYGANIFKELYAFWKLPLEAIDPLADKNWKITIQPFHTGNLMDAYRQVMGVTTSYANISSQVLAELEKNSESWEICNQQMAEAARQLENAVKKLAIRAITTFPNDKFLCDAGLELMQRIQPSFRESQIYHLKSREHTLEPA